MSYALGLPAALEARGLTVETVPGWETRSAGSFNPAGAVSHWTAGPATGDRPSLWVVVNGHSTLAGPLANVFLTRAGVAVVVAAGRANHAGAGGWQGLVGNSAVFGTEAENGGFDPWTAAQRWAYPRINAAYCDLGNFGPEMVCGHNEWAPTRKIDIRTYDMPEMRRQVVALLGGEAPLSATEVTAINDNTNTRVGVLDKNMATRFAALEARMVAESTSPAELTAALDAYVASSGDAIATRVAEKLGGTVDVLMIKQAMSEVLREGVGAA